MWPNLQETADLVTFTEEILNGKLHFLCIVISNMLHFSNMFQKKFLQNFKNIIKDVHSKKSNTVILSCYRCLYQQTFQKSIEQPERFWDELAQDITWFKKYTQVLDDSKQPFTKW